MKGDYAHFVAKEEHDQVFRVKRTSNFVSDGAGGLVREMTGDMQIRMAEDSGDSLVQYIGKSAPGTSTATAMWQIKKLDENNGVVITFADGNANFDNIWDNRESLTYT